MNMKNGVCFLLLYCFIIIGCKNRRQDFNIDYEIEIKNSSSRTVYLSRYNNLIRVIDTIEQNETSVLKFQLWDNEEIIPNYLPDYLDSNDSTIINFNDEKYLKFKSSDRKQPHDLYNINSYTIENITLEYTITQADYDNATPF